MIPEFGKVLAFLNSDELQTRVDFVTQNLLDVRGHYTAVFPRKADAQKFQSRVLSKLGEGAPVSVRIYPSGTVPIPRSKVSN